MKIWLSNASDNLAPPAAWAWSPPVVNPGLAVPQSARNVSDRKLYSPLAAGDECHRTREDVKKSLHKSSTEAKVSFVSRPHTFLSSSPFVRSG